MARVQSLALAVDRSAHVAAARCGPWTPMMPQWLVVPTLHRNTYARRKSHKWFSIRPRPSPSPRKLQRPPPPPPPTAGARSRASDHGTARRDDRCRFRPSPPTIPFTRTVWPILSASAKLWQHRVRVAFVVSARLFLGVRWARARPIVSFLSHDATAATHMRRGGRGGGGSGEGGDGDAWCQDVSCGVVLWSKRPVWWWWWWWCPCSVLGSVPGDGSHVGATNKMRAWPKVLLEKKLLGPHVMCTKSLVLRVCL